MPAPARAALSRQGGRDQCRVPWRRRAVRQAAAVLEPDAGREACARKHARPKARPWRRSRAGGSAWRSPARASTARMPSATAMASATSCSLISISRRRLSARQVQAGQALGIGHCGEAGLDADAQAMQTLDDGRSAGLGQVDRGIVGQLAPRRHVGEPAVLVALDPLAGADADQGAGHRGPNGGHGRVDVGRSQALPPSASRTCRCISPAPGSHHRRRVGRKLSRPTSGRRG